MDLVCLEFKEKSLPRVRVPHHTHNANRIIYAI